MADPAPDPAAPAATPPAAAAAPAPAADAPTQGVVRVKLRYPASSFDTGIKDVGTLTREPKEIPQALWAQVQDAAKKARVSVIEIKEQ